MSDEQYTVILGDRRYAIHRKWARLPAGESFGFLSDLMVDGEGRVHVAQRGTDQPVLVFERDGRATGSWGEGALAEPHYINAAPDGVILVADRDAHQVLRFDSDGQLLQALGKRHWPSLDAPFNHPTAAAQAPDGEIYVADGYGNSSVHRFAADGSLLPPGAARRRAGRLHDAARHRRRPPRPRAGRRPREQPRPGVRPRGRLPRRMGRLLSSDADLDRRPRPGVRDRPDPAHQPAHRSTASWSAAAAAPSTARTAFRGDADGNLYLAELPPQEITKLERLS